MTHIFDIVPAASRPVWLLVLVSAVMAVVVGVVAATVLGSRNSRFEVSRAGLRLRGDLYGRLIEPAALRTGGARVLDLRTEPSLRPRRRTMGTALPGYQAGWFRLRNGEKALLYLTDRTRAVYVPTTRGYSLLLSPQRPEEFLARLREIAQGD